MDNYPELKGVETRELAAKNAGLGQLFRRKKYHYRHFFNELHTN